MRILWLIGLAILSLVAAPSAAQPDAADETSVARTEIERILDADALAATLVYDGRIVAAMRAIPRGRAPDDFWEAYQTHLRAWDRFATAGRGLRVPSPGDPSAQDRAIVELGAADRAVNATFNEVARIASRYGARMPGPPARR